MTTNVQTTAMDTGAASRLAWKRLWPLAVLLSAAGARFAVDLHHFLSLDALREHRAVLSQFVAGNTLSAALIFIGVYTVATAVSLPGGAALSLAGGFLFGGLLGGAYVVLGATIGSTLVFLAARTALGQSLRRRAGPPGRAAGARPR